MDKHSDDFPDDKQGGLEFCEKVTRETVKWLNKKYGAYVKISYKCFFRVRQNPPVQDYLFTSWGLDDCKGYWISSQEIILGLPLMLMISHKRTIRIGLDNTTSWMMTPKSK